MYLAPNPTDLFARAVLRKGRLIFQDDSQVVLRFWTGQKNATVPPKLQVVRAYRADGNTELDPSFFTLENRGPIPRDPDGASKVILTFCGRGLRERMDGAKTTKFRRSWGDEFAAAGAHSLYHAFIGSERIYLHVAEVDKGGERIRKVTLGGLFLDLRYGAKRPKQGSEPVRADKAAAP